MRQKFGSFAPCASAAGAACWLAWIMVVYSGDSFLAAPKEAYDASSSAFILSTFALSVGLIAAACFPRQASRLVRSTRGLIAASCVGGVASVAASLSSSILPLFVASTVLTGLTTAVIALRCAEWTANLDIKDAVLGMFIALVVSVMAYGTISLARIHLGAWFSIVSLGLLVPASAVLLIAGDIEEDEFDPSLSLPRSFWRLVAFLAILFFALCSVRGYYPNATDVGSFAVSRTIVGLILIAIGIVGMMAIVLVPRKTSYGSLFYGMLIVATLSVVLVPVLGFSSLGAGVLGSISFGVSMITGWAWLSRVAYRSGAPVVRVFGFGFGFNCLTATAGFVLGARLYAVGSETSVAMVGYALVTACLVAALVLLRKEDMANVVVPVELSESGVPDGERAEGEQAASTCDGSPEQAAGRQDSAPAPTDDKADALPASTGKPQFKIKCQLIAEEHGLSSREAEVFLLLARGRDAQAVAEELFISFNTARTHIRHVYTKLDVHSRHELMDLVNNSKLELLE